MPSPREIVRQMGDTKVGYTTPMMQLQDPKQTKVLLVTLAETTPPCDVRNARQAKSLIYDRPH